jgi:tetratricopeptide (TPR) repeat protein
LLAARSPCARRPGQGWTCPELIPLYIWPGNARITAVAGYLRQGLGVAALWVVVPILCFVVALRIARFRSRRLERRRLRPKGVRTRLDVIRRDLNRMAEYRGRLRESMPAVWRPFELGLTAMAACQWDQAIGHFRSALVKAGGAQLVPVYNQLGVCHYIQGRADDALRDFDESARRATQYGDEKGKAPVLGNIGVMLHDYGEFFNALNAMNEALAVVRRFGDRPAAAPFLGNIGNVHRDQGELDKALQFHEEALALSRKVGDRSGVASSLGNIGNVYCDKDRLDEALPRYEQALMISCETGDRRVTASLAGNIANVHRYRGELNEALMFHEEALALEREIGYQAGVAAEQGNIGLILVDKELYKHAVLTLAESLAILLATGVAHGLRQALLGLSKCEDQLGRDRVQELLKEAGLANGRIADVLERIDQMRRKRPQPGRGRRLPFAPRRLAAGSTA